MYIVYYYYCIYCNYCTPALSPCLFLRLLKNPREGNLTIVPIVTRAVY